jgi:hypothetical protein
MLGPFQLTLTYQIETYLLFGAEQPDQVKVLLAQVTESGVDLRKELCLFLKSSSLSSKKCLTIFDRFKLVLLDIFLSKSYVSGDILNLIRYFRFLEYPPLSPFMKPPIQQLGV